MHCSFAGTVFSARTQPSGPISTPVKDVGADIQPEFGGADLIATSTPPDDSNVYKIPAASPTPVPEGKRGDRTPPVTLSPPDDSQLRVSPKRKVETMEIDMDSEAGLPTFQKKARANSGNYSDGEYYQWDDIPPPKETDRRLASRFPWGNETLVLGKPLSDFGSGEDMPHESLAGKLDDTTTSGDLLSEDGAAGGGKHDAGEDSLHSATSHLTQATARAGKDPSPPIMMGARPKGSSCSMDSCHSDFASPPREEATEPYRICAGRVMLNRTDWTHYTQQDEASPGVLHLEWPESLRMMGPVMVPGGSEGTYRQKHVKPHVPTFQGRVLRRKNGVKTAMSWGNAQERQAIRHTMKEAASAVR